MPSLDRLPPIAPEAMTEAQADAAQRMVDGRRGGLRGPFIPLLRSPELLNRAQALGDFLRYDSAIATDLREFAILVTASWWKQGYEWQVHRPLAEKAGVVPAILDALGARQRPEGMSAAQAAIHDFCLSVHREHGVEDAVYAAVLDLLGEAGLVDLCGICGYYALLAMALNVARTPSPDPATVPFRH